MKTILVPTDFSEIAINATLFAFELSKKNKARVILLHTYNLPFIEGQSVNFNANFLYDTIDLREFEYFKENIQKLRKLADEKNIVIGEMFHKLMLNELVSGINECVKDENVDFVVVGTSGGTDWFSKIFGTNTDSIISSVQVPTLVIPKDYGVEQIINIGFTTRFRDKDKIALRKTIEFAKKSGLKVKCMYAQSEESEEQNSLIKAWEKEFQTEKIDFVIYPSDDVIDAIDYFVVHHEIDILAMVTYKRDFFAELFSRRLTQKMSHNISIPLLVLHE